MNRFRAWVNGEIASTTSSIFALFELLGAFLLFQLLWRTPVDWQMWWPKDSDMVAMPWAFWFAADLLALGLVYHAVCQFARRRWALIVTGVIGLVGYGLTIYVLGVQLSKGFTFNIPFGEFFWKWAPFMVPLTFCWSAIKEGLVALKAKGLRVIPIETAAKPLDSAAG